MTLGIDDFGNAMYYHYQLMNDEQIDRGALFLRDGSYYNH
jgi:hypothetical protein